MYNVSETVLPIYINGQCPIIKTCSDVTLNLSSKDSTGIIIVNFAEFYQPNKYKYNSLLPSNLISSPICNCQIYTRLLSTYMQMYKGYVNVRMRMQIYLAVNCKLTPGSDQMYMYFNFDTYTRVF